MRRRTAQAWVTEILSSDGAFTTGVDAMHYDSACNPNTVEPNN